MNPSPPYKFPKDNKYAFKKGHKPWHKGTKGLIKANSGTFKKGYKPPNGFKKGVTPWNKGKKGLKWTAARRKAQNDKDPFNMGGHIYHGKTYSPFWHKIRKLICQRDQHTCQECGVSISDGKRINVHHIDYDITNNNPDNLISLCSSCHTKTNFNRIDWINYFNRNSKGAADVNR